MKTANANAFRRFDEVFVPEGLLRIAQRFSVGLGMASGEVPKGRLIRAEETIEFSRPFGTRFIGHRIPNAEALGYSRCVPPGQEAAGAWSEFPKSIGANALDVS